MKVARRGMGAIRTMNALRLIGLGVMIRLSSSPAVELEPDRNLIQIEFPQKTGPFEQIEIHLLRRSSSGLFSQISNSGFN